MPKHAATRPTARRVAVVCSTATAALLIGANAHLAFAEPSPPTEGGNGAGSSAQCTGPADERPTACQSPGGVSEK